MSVAGKVCVVTGGAKGIGRAIVERLAADGARVVLWDNDMDSARGTVEELVHAGTRKAVLAAQCVDITRAKDISEAVQQIANDFGTIDVLVNNAGIYSIRTLEDEQEDEWDRVLAINLKSVFLCIKAVAPLMVAQQSGRIVNLSSISGQKQSIFASASYCASKAGIIGLTRYVAASLAKHGITVNCIAPALTRTGCVAILGEERAKQAVATIPLGRMAEPADVAGAVLFLVSDNASFITGQTLSVNGGSFMP